MKKDMDKFRNIYANKRGIVPENESVIVLKGEDGSEPEKEEDK